MNENAKLLAGKRGLVFGVANDRSIAWGIARAAAAQGAELAFTFQGEALGKRVRPLAEGVGSTLVLPCDVTDNGSLDAVFETLTSEWGRLDFVVHAIAFSDKDQLKGKYMATTRENFRMTMDISVYSLTDITRRASGLMMQGGSIITLSYFGAERVMPHYNVMGVAKAALESSVRYLAMDLGGQGVRVNAISSGPIKTLAASGIGDFRAILRWNELNAPIERNITNEDVGNAALYLLSDLSTAVTGETLHVDGGYNIVGMVNPEAASGVAEMLAKLGNHD
ncbi:MAG: enoyl-ACP reductase FabI [Alphaproteobacteria bacterium]|nr:enoyl-ACP reductase FabI [Alphaproteobacteria bacterium]